MLMWISNRDIQHGYPCKGIIQWIAVEHEYPRVNIHVFIDISLHVSMTLLRSIWILIDFYGYPCMGLAIDSRS